MTIQAQARYYRGFRCKVPAKDLPMPSNPFQQATYTLSVHDLPKLPADTGFEAAFAGRSNAGKSSALNALCQQKALARTSKTPGRTQLINFFEVDDQHRLVDLPGYGFAKVPNKVKDHWHRLMEGYFQKRESLRGLVVVMDIRHPFKPQDAQMLDWCTLAGVPAHVLLTKADKLKRGAQNNTLMAAQRHLGDVASVQTFSALKRQGVDELIGVLKGWLELA